MKKNVLYYICKVLNCVAPLLILFFPAFGRWPFHECGLIIFCTYIVYFIARIGANNSGRGRMSYEIWIFVGFCVAGIYLMNTDIRTEYFILRILWIVLGVVVLLSKLITLVFETAEYNEGKEERKQFRKEYKLDEAVRSATYAVERAYYPEEKKAAEMKLERAKLERDRYYKSKKK